MPLWTLDNPPTWFPDAELTKEGWRNPDTGELLVAMQGDEDRVGPGTGLQRSLSGSSRIRVTSLQEQLGGAAMRAMTDQTQPGLSRLQVTQYTTLSADSRITATTDQTFIGNTSVRNTTVQTQTGVSDIRITSTQTMMGASLVVQRIGLPNMLVEYGFYSRPDLTITDLTGNGNDGTLSAPGEYTDLGLRLNGSQSITIPPAALPSSYASFTMFVLLQPEAALDDNVDLIVYVYGNDTPNYYAMYYYNAQEFTVDIGEAMWDDRFTPTKNVPFAVVQRYLPVGQLITQISENSDVPTKVGTYDFSSYGQPVFLGQNGILGAIRGTMIYFAIFQGDISNGESGHLFKFAQKMLLLRGTDPLLEGSFDQGAFQAGTFQ